MPIVLALIALIAYAVYKGVITFPAIPAMTNPLPGQEQVPWYLSYNNPENIQDATWIGDAPFVSQQNTTRYQSTTPVLVSPLNYFDLKGRNSVDSIVDVIEHGILGNTAANIQTNYDQTRQSL